MPGFVDLLTCTLVNSHSDEGRRTEGSRRKSCIRWVDTQTFVCDGDRGRVRGRVVSTRTTPPFTPRRLSTLGFRMGKEIYSSTYTHPGTIQRRGCDGTRTTTSAGPVRGLLVGRQERGSKDGSIVDSMTLPTPTSVRLQTLDVRVP